MRKLTIVAVLLFACLPLHAQSFWSMGYDTPFGNGYADTSTFLYGAVTHLSFLGAAPQADGTLALSTGPSFATAAPLQITAAHAHGVKILLCLTNLFGNGGSTDFTGAITNHEATLVANIMSVVNSYGFDGVDVDDEETFNATLLGTFYSDLRTQLGTNILTATIMPYLHSSWTPTLSSYLDRTEVMLYDTSGAGDSYTWFNHAMHSPSPGYLVWSEDLVIAHFATELGISPSKFSIGMPFYGYLSTANTAPQQSYGGSPTFTLKNYAQIVNNYNINSCTYDSTAHACWYAVSGSSWLNWNSPQSFIDDITYLKTQGIAGTFFWAINFDTITGPVPNPLLLAVQQGLQGMPTINGVTIQGVTIK